MNILSINNSVYPDFAKLHPAGDIGLGLANNHSTARLEALDSEKKPAPSRPGNRSPDCGSSSRRIFGPSWRTPAGLGLLRSSLSGDTCPISNSPVRD
jgi:hypothetical protein